MYLDNDVFDKRQTQQVISIGMFGEAFIDEGLFNKEAQISKLVL